MHLYSVICKKKKREPMRKMNLFVPPAGSYTCSGTWLLYAMIYLTEQCNRRTVHYSLVGKRSMLCAPGLWGTLADIMVLSFFSTLLFFSRGRSLTSENHLLLFIWTKHGSVLEQYQAVIFDVHSLQLDLFKSLCFRLGGYHGNSALQVYLSLCL